MYIDHVVSLESISAEAAHTDDKTSQLISNLKDPLSDQHLAVVAW